MVVLHASKWYHHINSPCECSICPIISEHCFDLICKFDAIFVGVGVECCFTALFDSNQFSNCYIHVYEKEARSRLFKMQDLPLTYMFEYHRFEFQPNWFSILIPIHLEFCNYFRIRSTWRSRACSCTLWNTCLTVAPTPSHDPWPFIW